MSAGWGFPAAARKAHYFEAGSATSVCGRWLFTGTRDLDNGSSSPDDCAACTKWLRKEGYR